MKRHSSQFRVGLTIIILAISIVLLTVSNSLLPTNLVSTASAQEKGGKVEPIPSPLKSKLRQPRSSSSTTTSKKTKVDSNKRMVYDADIFFISNSNLDDDPPFPGWGRYSHPRVQFSSSDSCNYTWKVLYTDAKEIYMVRLTDIDPISMKIMDVRGSLVYRKGEGEWEVAMKTYDSKDSIVTIQSEFGVKGEEEKSHAIHFYFNHELDLNRFFSGMQRAIRSCQMKPSHTTTTK
jgi:hypothetical protein